MPVNVLYREREVGHIVARRGARGRRDDARTGAGLVPAGRRRYGTSTALAAEADGRAPRTPGRRPRARGADDARRRSSTRRAPPAAPRAPCSRTATSPRTRARSSRPGASRRADRYLAVLPLFHVHGLGNGVCSLARERLPHAARRALRAREGARRSSRSSGRRSSSACRRSTCACSSWPTRRRARIGARTAPLRVRLGAAARARLRGLPGALRPRDPRALRHDRDADDARQPVRRRAAAGHGRAAARRVSRSRIVDAGRPRRARRARRASCWCAARPSSPATGGSPRPPPPRSPDGWFRTGDLGERAADGYVTLRGRASDLIICGGFNVYPREIEDVLLEQPGVREAAVVGVPDARRGEVPVAYFAGDADPGRSRPPAGASSRRSRCRARSCASTRCRATRWARSTRAGSRSSRARALRSQRRGVARRPCVVLPLALEECLHEIQGCLLADFERDRRGGRGPVAAQPACQGQNALSAAEKAAGWVLLFDGTRHEGLARLQRAEDAGLDDRRLRAEDRGHRGQLRQRQARRPRRPTASSRTSSSASTGRPPRAATAASCTASSRTRSTRPPWMTGPEYQFIDDVGFPEKLEEWQKAGAELRDAPAERPEAAEAGGRVEHHAGSS